LKHIKNTNPDSFTNLGMLGNIKPTKSLGETDIKKLEKTLKKLWGEPETANEKYIRKIAYNQGLRDGREEIKNKIKAVLGIEEVDPYDED
jgi:hypothetical protein